jgi:lipopolysaccharide biosynthesis glycosyltransferase
VFDAGIRDENWTCLSESLRGRSLDLIRMPVDVTPLRHLKTSHHISHAAFVRLLAAELLPSELDRVIYLDSDFLFRDDLRQIWQWDLGDSWCAAVPDIACPYVDARFADSNFRKSSPYMATISPIRNWSDLSLDPAAPYFNSGLMLIDLQNWRRNGLNEKFLKCLSDHPRHIWCWDQYALNVVLAGHWKPLPMRWNQGSHVFEYPSVAHSPIDPAAFQEMIQRPAAIHFTTEFKPWLFGSRHPHRDEYFRALRETFWAEWQPQRPNVSVQRISQKVGTALVKNANIAWRKFQAMFYRPPNSLPNASAIRLKSSTGLPANSVEAAHKP